MTDATALDGRKTWRTLEPLHGMVYFAPEAASAYEALGLQGAAGYFVSRSAPMGRVGAEVVIATFFNFCPRLVRGATAGAWDIVTPEAVLEARLAAAGAALERMLGEAVHSPEMGQAATIVRQGAQAACERPEGRPLFAGHAALDWPEADHLVLWHAQSLLREYRGDGHIVALVGAGLGPVEALVMHAASGEVPAAALRATRAWNDAEWDEGVELMRSKGWLAPRELTLSPLGMERRQAIEDLTDELALHPYRALGAERCAELRALARPFSKAVVPQMGPPPFRTDPSS
jgi:hypothetical protein